jgi:hypothetical protein
MQKAEEYKAQNIGMQDTITTHHDSETGWLASSDATHNERCDNGTVR